MNTQNAQHTYTEKNENGLINQSYRGNQIKDEKSVEIVLKQIKLYANR